MHPLESQQFSRTGHLPLTAARGDTSGILSGVGVALWGEQKQQAFGPNTLIELTKDKTEAEIRGIQGTQYAVGPSSLLQEEVAPSHSVVRAPLRPTAFVL